MSFLRICESLQMFLCNKWEYPCAFNEIPTFISSTWINHYLFVGMGVEWGAGATPLSAEFWSFFCYQVGWVNGPLRQYFSLYRAVFQRGRKNRKDRPKQICPNNPTRTYCMRNRPLPYNFPQFCRTLRHWKFTQHLRTTRPSPCYQVNFAADAW